MRKLIFFSVLLGVLLLYGRDLNPFSSSMFTFHDETQPARIKEFALNLSNLKIPPRIAPDFSFKLGYPIFDIYAPASYWITTLIHMLGPDIVNALKLSFLLSILLGFMGMYLFLKEYFDFFPAVVGSVLYISSLYYPVEIFVRGNLGEVWFLALLPLALFFTERLVKKPTRINYFLAVIVFFLLFTVHNLLSFSGLFIILIYSLLRPNKKRVLLSIFISLVLSSYFLIPLFFENQLTYAKDIAVKTVYSKHFICPYELWQSNWGYGGSTGDCNDGFSFKIGKIQLVLFTLGIILGVWNLLKGKRRKTALVFLYLVCLSIGSLFMSTYLSKPVWDLFAPILSLFQFPWRFISFSLLGVGFSAAYLFHYLQFPLKNIVILLLIIIVFMVTSKYFVGQNITKKLFETRYLLQNYIYKEVAYKVPEYLPKTAQYNTWRIYENDLPDHKNIGFDYLQPVEAEHSSVKVIRNGPFKKEIKIFQPDTITLNIHYFPVWHILINNKDTVPTSFDQLGRPVFALASPSTVLIQYRETGVERIGNILTVFAFIWLIVTISNKKIWSRSINI